MKTANLILEELQMLACHEVIKSHKRFFKTAPGEYGHADIWLGIYTAPLRSIAKKCRELNPEEIGKLLRDPHHEARMVALMILVEQFRITTQRKNVVDCYLKNLDGVNNWDLVDASAHTILGAWTFLENDPKILFKFAQDKRLWRRRIAMVATWAWIRKKQLTLTQQIAEKLLQDPEDLIQKSIGWMLREVGKKDESILRNFLHQHASSMSSVALRYAIERFPDEDRKYFLKMRNN